MSKYTHTYTVAKGDTVRPQFVGTEIELVQFDTMAEAIEAGHFESERAIMYAANAQRNIDANRAVRKVLSKDDGSAEKAREAGNAIKRAEPRVASGEPRKQSSGAIKDAKETENTLFAACRADEQLLRRMVKLGAVKQDLYDRWLERTIKAEQAAAQPAQA